MEQDIRWQQRLENYKKALYKLKRAIDTIEDQYTNEEDEDDDFNEEVFEMLKEGLVQRFEYTYELAWNLMKDYAYYQGNYDIKGSRDATREAFKMGLIEDSETWMAMLESRKLTTHTYNKSTAEEISTKIVNSYYALFESFKEKMESLL